MWDTFTDNSMVDDGVIQQQKDDLSRLHPILSVYYTGDFRTSSIWSPITMYIYSGSITEMKHLMLDRMRYMHGREMSSISDNNKAFKKATDVSNSLRF